MLIGGSVHIVSLGKLCVSLKGSLWLTWNKKSQVDLSADPVPVVFAPAQQGAAPRVQRRKG